ncbi:MAG: glutathione S-transferase family protein [Steroidobacteraceae bacterium]|jgi:glutathione S-transferase|nr:glutathione S-transferase family protein [Steroidobacteraceae bacterium]
MKLYSNRFAPSPRRVRMYAAEKGLSLDVVEVDLAAGEHQAPGYRVVNPLSEVPTLELGDGTRVTESLAICRWLEELHPVPPLFGRDADERREVNRWIDRLMFRLYVPTTHVFRHTHSFWATRLQQVPAWGEQQRTTVLAEYAALDALLAEREYVAGATFSMADIVAFTSIDFGKPSGLRLGEAHAHARRWYEAVKARPSAAA